jgi:hypothetical protein
MKNQVGVVFPCLGVERAEHRLSNFNCGPVLKLWIPLERLQWATGFRGQQ